MPATAPTAGAGLARAERFAVAELDDVDETGAGRGRDDEHAELRCLRDGDGGEGHATILRMCLAKYKTPCIILCMRLLTSFTYDDDMAPAGRPAGQPSTTKTIRMLDEHLDFLEDYMAKHGPTLTWIVNRAVSEWVERQKAAEPKKSGKK